MREIVKSEMSQIKLENTITRRNIVFLLGIIIFTGIVFRLLFSHFEIPFNSDNLQYFLYAIDHSLGETKNSFKVHNIGWPIFVSFFFSIFNSNNYMDFMGLQKIISIVISSLTAIPIYFICKKFFVKKLALIGSFLFVFDPRIIQNSTFGISDPLYILGISTAIALLLHSKKNFEYISFIILGLSITVRSEGLFLIPAFVIVYLWQNNISKKSVGRITISLLIISLILTGVTYYKNSENMNEGIFYRIESGVGEIYSSPETKLAGSPMNLLIDGITNFIKFLAWTQFPIWVIFVPIGFIILFKLRDKNTGVIFTLLFFISLPTLYAFSFTNDTRYLYPLYPIFSVLALYFINKIYEKRKEFPFIIIGTVIGVIILSSFFIISKDIDPDHEQKIFSLAKEITDKEKIVNYYGYESSYRIPAALEKIENFPITSIEIEKHSTKIANARLNSLEEFMEFGIENKLTHWIIKENNHLSFLDDIYHNEKDYSFLTIENSYGQKKYENNLKIFKVDYNNYQLP